MNKNYRYGIFGGSFDPIHIGHLRLALAAADELNLDKLILMPNYISPFKQGEDVTSAYDRIEMAKTYESYCSAFEVSNFEASKEGPSYTFETLEYFNNNYEGELYFVLGYDSIMTLDTWYRGEDIIRKYPLITGRRPGTEDAEGTNKIDSYRKLFNARIHVLNIEPFDASSTEIRQLIRNNESTDGLLTTEVQNYIKENDLYK
ncbi:MAG: nicotinate (nicotinamide) nucleotide adenylyltransferase [Mogibacterium sp.]|nr:nicotinate (nicotinamide) nucleotide adenylyltransferase [Mogibacterium sp.]